MLDEMRWLMHGLAGNDPGRIKDPLELEAYIEKTGFLPLFRNEIKGFSVEEMTASESWWTSDEETDPWEWRKVLSRRGNVAYGKFFDKKAGFISKEWFPDFANYRRDGYDFDARWDDELAGIRSKKIMDLFMDDPENISLFSTEVKAGAGFGKTGEKNFEGEITALQMMGYLCACDFRQRRNRAGEEYGWGIAVYACPEKLWGYDYVTSAYRDDPKASASKIFEHIRSLYPGADMNDIIRIAGIRRSGEPSVKKTLPYPDNLIKALKTADITPETMTEDRLDGLKVAVAQLVSKQRRVLEYKYIQNMKYEEIGKLMNRAAGTVSGYHSKAMKRLRWPSLKAWYTEGYKKAFEKSIAAAWGTAPDESALKIGMHLKTYQSLARAGIKTTAALREASAKKDWYAAIKGIGPKTAQGILDALKKYDEGLSKD